MAAAYVAPTFANWAHKVFQLPSSSSSSSCIYLGPFQAATKSSEVRQSLIKHNVTAIINCTQDAPCYHYDLVEYCRIPVRDETGADILPYLWGVTSFMHVHLTNQRKRQSLSSSLETSESFSPPPPPQPQSVLVHCEMGISRSTTVVLAYLIRFQNLTKEAAYNIVKNNRPQANPNPGFWKQLDEFEQMVVSRKQNGDELLPSVDLKKKKEIEEHNDERFLLYEWSKLSSATFITTVGVGNSIHLLQGRNDKYSHTSAEKDQEGEILIAKFIGGEENIHKDVFSQHDSLLIRSGITNLPKKKQVETLVNGALDYVWSRGVLDIDLLWFKALVDFLQERLYGGRVDLEGKNIVNLLSSSSRKTESTQTIDVSDQNSGDNGNETRVREMVMSMLEGGSDFYDSWTGEIYEGQIQRVIKVLME